MSQRHGWARVGVVWVATLGRRGSFHGVLALAAIVCVAAIAPSTAFAATADAYEDDDTYSDATTIAVGDVPQQRTIEVEDEVDWVAFQVTAGKTYRVETTSGDPVEDFNADMELYDSDGTTMLTWGDGYYYDEWTNVGDDYGGIEYMPDVDKWVYVRISSDWSDPMGAYALQVTTSSDDYEPDNAYGSATPIAVNGSAQQHNIYPHPGEQDWVSFPVNAGWKYTIMTVPGADEQDPDTQLALYDSDGSTEIDWDDDEGVGSYSFLEYASGASETVYVCVTGGSVGTYALSVTGVAVPRLAADAGVDLGATMVGSTSRRTLVVQNTGAAPLTISGVQIEGAGFTIVRNEALGSAIPPGESREIEVQFAPTVGYSGAPAAVKHSWTSTVAEWNYSGGVLVSYYLYSGFQNVGGAGSLPWRLTCGTAATTGTGPVVAGGRYIVRAVVYKGTGSGLVQLVQPVSAGWDFAANTLGSLGAVTYIRVADGTLTIQSNDSEAPETSVSLYGAATKRSAAKVSLTLSGLRRGVLIRGRRLTAKGKVTCADLSARTVKLTVQRKRGTRWVTVKTVSRTLSTTQTYSWRYRPLVRGSYRMRTTVAKTATNLAGASTWRSFRVR